jgi:hypothetical protein
VVKRGNKFPSASLSVLKSGLCFSGPLRAASMVQFVPVISVIDSGASSIAERGSVQSPIGFQRGTTGLDDRPVCRRRTFDPPVTPAPPSRFSGSQKTFSAKPGSFSGDDLWLAPLASTKRGRIGKGGGSLLCSLLEKIFGLPASCAMNIFAAINGTASAVSSRLRARSRLAQDGPFR